MWINRSLPRPFRWGSICDGLRDGFCWSNRSFTRTFGSKDELGFLFCEEPGGVIQVRKENKKEILKYIEESTNLLPYTHTIGRINDFRALQISTDSTSLTLPLEELLESYSENTHAIQSMRDNLPCANQELATITNLSDPGLSISGYPKNHRQGNQEINVPRLLF